MNKKTILAISMLLSFSANASIRTVAIVQNNIYLVEGDDLLVPILEVKFDKIFDGVFKFAIDTDGTIWKGDNSNQWTETKMTGFSDLSISETHGYALKDGTVYAIGDNQDGQLGLGDLNFRNEWIETTFTGVSDIEAVGGDDGCISQGNGFAIKSGVLYSIGANTYSQLGRVSPDKCDFRDCAMTWGATNLSNIKKVEGGVSTIFALANNNQLFGTGSSDYTSIGSDNFVPMLSGVTDISADSLHAYALKDGVVYSQGTNEFGQLGTGSTTEENNFVATSLTGISSITAFGDGDYYSGVSGGVAVKDGDLYVIGSNQNGELGLGSSNRDIVQSWRSSGLNGVTEVFKGLTPYIKKDDKINYSKNGVWSEISINIDSDKDGVYDHIEIEEGTNPSDPNDFVRKIIHPNEDKTLHIKEKFQYIDEGGVDNNYPDNASSTLTLTTEKGKLLSVSFDKYESESGSDFLSIYSGLDSSGKLLKKCEGQNCMGNEYTSIEGPLTFVFQSDGSFTYYGWDATINVKDLILSDYDKDGIYDHIDLDDDNDTYSDIIEENAGTNPLDENDYPSLVKFKKVRAGLDSGYAIDVEDNLWVVGYNEYSQLGLNDKEARNIWTKTSLTNVKDIDLGFYHGLVLDNSGDVWVSGMHGNGQLGLGDRGCGSSGGTCRAKIWTKVDTPLSMSSRTIQSIDAGEEDSYALDTTGKIWVAGENNDGQLGLGNTDKEETWTEINSSTAIYYENIIGLGAGEEHAYALDSNGKIWGVGSNASHNELGIGPGSDQSIWIKTPNSSPIYDENITKIYGAEDSGYAVSSSGKLWVIGKNVDGQLGVGNENSVYNWQYSGFNNVSMVSTMEEHALILLSNSELYSAGEGRYGKLGLGDTQDKNVWTKINTTSFGAIKDISAGKEHSYLIDENGYIWGVGSNQEGQLGLGDLGCSGYGCESLTWTQSLVFK